MTAVEQPQFHRLEGRNLGHEDGAPASQTGRPSAAPIAGMARSPPARHPQHQEHPQSRYDRDPSLPARSGDHGGWASDLGDESGQPRIPELGKTADTLQHMAVRRKIVAGQKRVRSHARRPPAGQSLDDEADGRSRVFRILQIVDYIGMIVIQHTGRRIVAVPLFGHRQRDNAGRRVRQSAP